MQEGLCIDDCLSRGVFGDHVAVFREVSLNERADQHDPRGLDENLGFCNFDGECFIARTGGSLEQVHEFSRHDGFGVRFGGLGQCRLRQRQAVAVGGYQLQFFPGCFPQHAADGVVAVGPGDGEERSVDQARESLGGDLEVALPVELGDDGKLARVHTEQFEARPGAGDSAGLTLDGDCQGLFAGALADDVGEFLDGHKRLAFGLHLDLRDRVPAAGLQVRRQDSQRVICGDKFDALEDGLWRADRDDAGRQIQRFLQCSRLGNNLHGMILIRFSIFDL